MKGKPSAGRRAEAYLCMGEQQFKRSRGEDNDVLGDGADSERKFLDDLAQRLMNGGEA